MSDKNILLNDCPDCKGKGTIRYITDSIHEECEKCDGKGKVLKSAIELVHGVIPKKQLMK